jgi:hypothetical protein
MILTLLQTTKAEEDIDFVSSKPYAASKNRLLSGPNPGLSLTRSEEFLNGTHDIFDILVLQNTSPLTKGDKQAP